MLARISAAVQEGRLLSSLKTRAANASREWQLRRRLGLRLGRSAVLWTNRRSPSARHLISAFEAADNSSVTLPNEVRAIEGMSGQKYRSFINRLVQLTPDPKYLEIGSWAGSTACAAMSGNRVEALCIDDWSLFGGPKEAFFANVSRIKTPEISFKFIEQDFRSIDFSALGKFNLYLFDGPHTEQDQYDGVLIAGPALRDKFVLIVDDWNWNWVRFGTFQAIADSDITVQCAVEIRTTHDNTHPVVSGRESDWHNGYFIAALKKGA